MADVTSLDEFRNRGIEKLGAANMAKLSERSSAKGKKKYSIEVSGDTLLVDTDPLTLGAGPAEAIASVLRAKMQAIAAAATPSTMAFRESALASFVRGAPWAKKRYSGGRMGTRVPAQSDRAFNDSGRFAESLLATANRTQQTWSINVAANRLNTIDAPKIFARLAALVPEFADTRRLLDAPQVTAAIDTGISAATVKASEGSVDRELAVMRSRITLLRAIG